MIKKQETINPGPNIPKPGRPYWNVRPWKL